MNEKNSMEPPLSVVSRKWLNFGPSRAFKMMSRPVNDRFGDEPNVRFPYARAARYCPAHGVRLLPQLGRLVFWLTAFSKYTYKTHRALMGFKPAHVTQRE